MKPLVRTVDFQKVLITVLACMEKFQRVVTVDFSDASFFDVLRVQLLINGKLTLPICSSRNKNKEH